MFKCLSEHRDQAMSQLSPLMRFIYLFIYLLLLAHSLTFLEFFLLYLCLKKAYKYILLMPGKVGICFFFIFTYTELSQKYFCHYKIFLLLVINVDIKFSSDLYFQRQNLPPADIIFITETLNYYLASECMKTLFSELRPFSKVILIFL